MSIDTEIAAKERSVKYLENRMENTLIHLSTCVINNLDDQYIARAGRDVYYARNELNSERTKLRELYERTKTARRIANDDSDEISDQQLYRQFHENLP